MSSLDARHPQKENAQQREHKDDTNDDGSQLYERAVPSHFKGAVVAATTLIEHTHANPP